MAKRGQGTKRTFEDPWGTQFTSNWLYGIQSDERFEISQEDALGSCRSIREFEKLNKVGEGTYGVVYRARDKKSLEIVAIKALFVSNVGFQLEIAREINNLMNCKHINVVELLEVVVSPSLDYIFLVMSFCEHDLASLLDNMKAKFTEGEVKCIITQLFKGLAYLHRKFIIHRDLKPHNVLMTNRGIIKIGDFGLSRTYSESLQGPMTPSVVTMWYRAPELLLGFKKYTTSIDMWAAGCIFGELLLNQAMLPGRDEIQQFRLIVDLIGSPSVEIWPEFGDTLFHKHYSTNSQPFNNIREKFSWICEAGQTLMLKLLVYNPKLRLTASDSLMSSYFTTHPLPVSPNMMPTFPEHRNQMYDSSDRPQESRPAPFLDISIVNHLIGHQRETKK